MQTEDPSMDNHQVSSNETLILNGLRLLVVDDNRDTRELFTFILENSGAQVLAVASVKHALEAIEQFRPDILISDIQIPDEDGYTLIHEVKNLATSQGGQIPIIAVTGCTQETDGIDVLSAGCQSYLCKPVDPDELIAAIANLAKPEVNS